MLKKLKNIFVFNKEIFCLKLSLTTACNLRCRYCFVRKASVHMELITAFKAIDFFLFSKGKEKLLILYGGEPLMYPHLKKVIIYARKKAKRLKKKIIIALPTNGTLINKKILRFFKKYKVLLSISIDGSKKFHNQNKLFFDKKGSYDIVLRNSFLAFKILGRENVSALMTIAPNLAKYLYKNFLFLYKLGFSKIHIDPVHGIDWTEKEKREFILNFRQITSFCFKSIINEKFIFLCPLFNPLTNQWMMRKQEKLCPFYVDLEIYPNGEMSFSQFLINSPDEKIRSQIIIGNITSNFLKDNYKICKYKSSSKKCQLCLPNYYQSIPDPKFKGSDLVEERNKILEEINNKIYFYSLTNERYKNYYQEAKNLLKKLVI